METKFGSKNAKNIECIICNFKCSKNSEYLRHILTLKHEKLTAGNKIALPTIFECNNCEKIYKTRVGLWKHKKICIKLQYQEQSSVNINQNIATPYQSANQIEKLTNLFFDVVKQNQELQKQLLEIAKEGKNITNNNNSHNKFNLNFFLNEQCKDALNITDFVASLKLKLSDLENVGQFGYAQGISNIFINGLKQLDIFKRPIHCSDLKRETMYVKDKDAWEKENDKRDKLNLAIKCLAHKNVKQIPEWQQENPEYKDGESEINGKFLKIVNESMGGYTDEEDVVNYNKIIRNVAKEVSIDRV